jgi:hypothetical protein
LPAQRGNFILLPKFDFTAKRDFDAKKRMELKVEMQNQPSQPKQSIAI